jgi:hypothetical protein
LAAVLIIAEPPKAPTPSEQPSVAPVSAPFAPDTTTIADCDGLAGGQRIACLGQAIGNVAYRSSATASLTAIVDLVGSDATIGSDCHVIAHRIGAGIMARVDGALGVGAAEIGAAPNLQFCGAGAFHGLLIETTARRPGDDPAVLLTEACANTPLFEGDPRTIGACAHGAGHAFVQAYEWDLPMAIAACAAFPEEREGARMRRECAIGAYMEALQNGRLLGTSYVRIGEPTYPCTTINDWSADICWRMAGIVMSADGIVIEEQPALCRTAPDATRRYACLSAITDGVATAYAADLALIRTFCATAADEEYPLSDCLTYAAAKRGGDRQHPEEGAVLCRDISDETERSDCFAAIGAKLSGQVGIERCDEIVDLIERASCNRSLLPPTPGEP